MNMTEPLAAKLGELTPDVLKIDLAGEEFTQAGAHDGMVISDHDPDHVRPRCEVILPSECSIPPEGTA